MLTQTKYFCQLKILPVFKDILQCCGMLFLMVLAGCATTESNEEKRKAAEAKTLKKILVHQNLDSRKHGEKIRSALRNKVRWTHFYARPRWFVGDKKYASTDQSGKVLAHPYFDLDPHVNTRQRTLNFFVVTPEDSSISYDFDLVSGRKFKKYFFCEQDDVWEKYGGSISNPPYTKGIVPRVLDDMGRPQEIIVFGRKGYYNQDHGVVGHKVRVVGGMVEQVCDGTPCQRSTQVNNRMILVAIDPVDDDFKDVYFIHQLKKKVDWEYVMAFLQNSNGKNYRDEKFYPAFRVVGEIKPRHALKFSRAYHHVFTPKELTHLKKSCTKLYDFTWKYLGKNQTEKIKGKSPSNFTKRFQYFYRRFGKRFQTCTDFVRSSNINIDPERHWFFAHLTAFFKLQRLGYVYSCKNKSWSSNPKKSNGKRYYDPPQIIGSCGHRSMNMAFEQSILMFSQLKKMLREHYYYKEYDNGIGGTHQKIYSWVRSNSKRLDCSEEDLAKNDQGQFIFPGDVEWKYKK